MGITRVGAGSVVAANSGTASPSVHASTQVNDLILAVGGFDATASTCPTPSGYTELARRGTHQAVFGRLATGSDACAFAGIGSSFMCQTLSYRGILLDLANIVDVSYPVTNSVSSTNIRMPAGSAPALPGALMFFFGRSSDLWTSVAAPSTNAGWTEQTDQTYGSGISMAICVDDSIQTTPVAITQEDLAITGGSSTTNTGILLALLAATGITLVNLERSHRGTFRGVL